MTACLVSVVASILTLAVATVLLLRYLSPKKDDLLIHGPFGTVLGSVMSCRGRLVYAFRGVPFAQPPVGDLRFREAVAARDGGADSLYDGTRPPAPCLQGDKTDKTRAGGERANVGSDRGREDCLTLSIWKPPGACEAGPLAVLFVVHGHFFQMSHADNEGRCLAALGDVVVVAPHYRLGAMGFLNAPPEAPGNVGLSDLVVALNWTRTYAPYFCGDAANIVAFGHNAGASAVGYLLHNQEVFSVSRAILINETPFTRYFDNTINAKANLATLAERLSCDSNRTRSVLDCMRNATAAQVMQSGALGRPIFFPSYNQTLMRFPPYDRNDITSVCRSLGALHRNACNFKKRNSVIQPDRIDLLVGHTDDNLFNLADTLRLNLAQTEQLHLPTAFLTLLGIETPMEIIGYYQKAAHTELLHPAVEEGDADAVMLNDVLHACPARFYGQFLSQKFNRVSSFVLPRLERSAKTVAAATDLERWRELDEDLRRALGTFLPDQATDSDVSGGFKLSATLIYIWASFATAGRLPAVNNAPWPRVTGYAFPVVHIRPNGLTLLNDSSREERCKFLEPRLLL
ncbi:acetylcholinesterase-1-like isoform X2 [Dermacentor albipictus]|uniref:acetylcholinesterase-1-like isoform X2 n=1 Tax=Dermacentor albipictus TaxID=60249 RepID=UPI0031FC28D3